MVLVQKTRIFPNAKYVITIHKKGKDFVVKRAKLTGKFKSLPSARSFVRKYVKDARIMQRKYGRR